MTACHSAEAGNCPNFRHFPSDVVWMRVSALYALRFVRFEGELK